jgi:hypothetical protein
MSSILAYKMLLRLKWGPLALTLVSILLILMVTGVLASVQNISSYSTEEIARIVPVHYMINLEVTPGEDKSLVPELHRELVGLRGKLRTGIADNVVTLAQVNFGALTKLITSMEGGAGVQQLPTQTTTVGIIRVSVIRVPSLVDRPMIGSFYGGIVGVKIVEGAPSPDSIGLNLVLVESGLGDVLLKGVREAGVKFNNTYIFNCNQPIPCPLLLLDSNILDSIISGNPWDVLELRYTYMVNFSLGAFTVLAPESVMEASADYDRVAVEVLKEALNRVVSRVNLRSSSLSGGSYILASTISAFSGAYLLVSAFIFSLTLPVVVASWILARSIGELVAYDVRRFTALGLIRGLPLRSFTLGFLALSLTLSALAVASSLPLLRVLVDVTARLAIGKVYYLPPLIDIGYMISSIVMALSVSALVYVKVRGILKGHLDLTQASRLYLQAVHESWRPSTSLTILFAISLFKYILWITGTRSTELVRIASEIHPLLVVITVFYVLLDFFIGFVAPVIIPYYLTLILLSREGFMRGVATITSRVIGGNLGDLASSAIPRISPRFSSLTASTTITLSFVVAASIIRASISEWYDVNSPVLTGRSDFGSTFFNTMALSMMFYSIIAFTLLSGFILVSSVMAGYTLFKSLERELSNLKTRGVPLGGLVRFTYAQVFSLTLIALLLSPLGVVSAKGFIETFNSVFSGPLTARGLLAPSLTIDLVGVSVVLLAVFLSLIAPLALLIHMSRRLGLELVSRV